MTRIERNRYSVLIRGDYLYELGKLGSIREERDKIIQQAIERFLAEHSMDERRKEIRAEMPRMRIMHAAGHKPDYHMYFEIVTLPDHLVERMDRENRYERSNIPFCPDLGTVLNAAIRTYLEAEDLYRIAGEEDLSAHPPQPSGASPDARNQ